MSHILCILDGFGIAPKSFSNAVSLAKTNTLRYLLKTYPWITLNADGDFVGQEEGLVGNSEVGHMNLGGLKLVPQLSYQITKSSQFSFDLNKDSSPDQNFDPKKFLKKNFDTNPSKNIHLIGLFSTGTIHSDMRHWIGAIETADKAGARNIVLHLISDGRDSSRESLVSTFVEFTQKFSVRLESVKNKLVLGSLGGRFWAMDRDNNWERVVTGFSSMLHSSILNNPNLLKISSEYKIGEKFWTCNKFDTKAGGLNQFVSILENSTKKNYSQGVFDETILPEKFLADSTDNGINTEDTVWLINFRTDRFKQLTKILTDLNQKLNLKLTILGMNDYGVTDFESKLWDSKETIKTDGYYSVFKSKPVRGTLAEKISEMGMSQLHLAETEKYNHVTFFFNGGQNKKSKNEDWVVIPSDKVTSYAEKPEMKAVEITDYLLQNVNKYDYIVVNYANPDMVGHTGDLQASIQAVEVLDTQLKRLVEIVEKEGHTLIITADHGNIEMVGPTDLNNPKNIDTEHNNNPVPLIWVAKENTLEYTKNLIQQLPNIKSTTEKIETAFDEFTTFKNDPDNWTFDPKIYSTNLPLFVAGVLFLTAK